MTHPRLKLRLWLDHNLNRPKCNTKLATCKPNTTRLNQGSHFRPLGNCHANVSVLLGEDECAGSVINLYVKLTVPKGNLDTKRGSLGVIHLFRLLVLRIAKKRRPESMNHVLRVGLAKPLLCIGLCLLKHQVLKPLEIVQERRRFRIGILGRRKLKTHVVALLTGSVKIVFVHTPREHLRRGEFHDRASMFVEHWNVFASTRIDLRVAEVEGGSEVIRHAIQKESHDT